MNLNAYLNSPRALSEARAIAAQKAEDTQALAIIAAWAKRTGHEGPRHSQTRQGIRRRIRKHGINSTYAEKFKI